MGPATPWSQTYSCASSNSREAKVPELVWEDVWARDAWLDILGRFIHLVPGESPTHAAQLKAGSVIFPRHQWEAVCRLETAARAEGPGYSYLVEHSAGSGKSNTIA